MRSSAAGAAVIAVDQGTSATKALLIDGAGAVVARESIELAQQHPHAGWVEQDPVAILESVTAVVDRLRRRHPGDVAAIGLSTQRESALAWDPATGEPLSAVISWQDRRTADRARQLANAAERVRAISGLPLDPMFSALKFAWILDQIDPDRRRARDGRIALGTVDAWLLWKLTGEHRIEVGNASRTQLLDLSTGRWSDELLDLFGVPAEALPRIAASDEGSPADVLGLPLGAVLGDSHAALYAHGVRTPGDVKVTYGTGSSVMGLSEAPVPGPGLVGTIAWGVGGRLSRAFEGNILSTGATVRWLAGVLGATPDELARRARSVPDSGGVDIVPAFHGLGAPWWDEEATGIISGLQLGTGGDHLARAAFESIVLQIDDVLRAAEAETGRTLDRVLVDGGPSRNDWLMQLQADVAGRTLLRHDGADLSALGVARLAAEMAGPGAGSDGDPAARTAFEPRPAAEPDRRRRQWEDAVARSRADVQPPARPAHRHA